MNATHEVGGELFRPDPDFPGRWQFESEGRWYPWLDELPAGLKPIERPFADGRRGEPKRQAFEQYAAGYFNRTLASIQGLRLSNGSYGEPKVALGWAFWSARR